ncbi:MAG: hypothetical protein ACREKI_07300 [Gemmatimonadota bacterium]
MIAHTLKDKLILILTVFLVVCALVITSAVIFLVLSRCSPWAGRASATADRYVLPVSHRLPQRAADLLRARDPVRSVLSTTVRGLPLVPEFATVVRIAGRDRLLLPVLMQEDALPVHTAMALANPLRWKDDDGFFDCTVGRRSLWYMPVGSTMLYGVLVDPHERSRRVGLGFVLVKRLDEDRYDVLLEDSQGNTLFAARGRLLRLNPAIGQGTLEPEADQSEVRRLYGPRWKIDPATFLLFSAAGPA